MTSLPTWALYAVGIGTPILSFMAVLIGNLLLRRGATELDIWRRREETMRMLRWAAEQAVSTDDAKARLGVAALQALSTSELLQAPDDALLDAVLDAVLAGPVEQIEEAGEEADVVEVDTEADD
ncbi:hypothetical protein SAMN06264364_12286 [Quadrisphaera granulorum]|uniref:Uncharacterized protein n=1 Tax=Quadrisphaera granulorum TaxID=317664 RepID=A0A316A0V4_9ACTN|nr:hypothetical protein [Quadrisphaera granulorum]PWJ50710.1 hypothetical protein BXY45_12286 [Quadrisphaera granulorum]SZE97958.1 hypothetical protein SAMN06264364_12286 [Quadrisphaera granulorum]